MKTIEGYDVKIFTDNIEENAIEQIKELLSIDVFADKKIRIMPDVHAGAGCVIGFTGNLGNRVIPNIVGVDIGCGMLILNLGKLTDIDFHAFHEHIRSNVPSGMIVREDRFGFKPLVGEEMDIYREAKELVIQLRCYRSLKDSGRINKAIGSLGGGNHFIELDKDDAGDVYLVIHTGSRNLGKQVADIYQAKAVKHLTDGDDEFDTLLGNLAAEGEELTVKVAFNVTAAYDPNAAGGAPMTGDSSAIGLWVALLVISAFAFIILLFLRKREQDEEKSQTQKNR